LRVKPERDELSIALEGLRDHPLVAESRDYALRWERSRARSASLRAVMLGSAAAIAAACLLVYSAFMIFPRVSHSSAGAEIATAIGERRAIVLSDHSRLLLDTSSRVRIAFTGGARDLELLDGQAHFEVAPDPHRPFRVRTRAAEIVAVGTKFDVVAMPGQTTVTLIEGRVNVRAISRSARLEPQMRSLIPGQQLGISAQEGLMDPRSVQVASATAWQRGMIVIDDLPVPEALAMMNRYSRQQIVVLGPALRMRKVSGVFRSGDVETEALVLERYFGLREVSRSEHEIVLERD
jgi:transmembrane sensor